MKLLDLQSFTESVGNFELSMEERLPGEVEGWFEEPTDAYIAYVLPWVEVLAALALLTGFGKTGGLTIFLGMLISFNLALWSAWDRGIVDLNCGCHGASETPTNFGLKIAGNFGLMYVVGVIFWLIWYHRREVRFAEELAEVESYKDLT